MLGLKDTPNPSVADTSGFTPTQVLLLLLLLLLLLQMSVLL